jgi:hypothetical protein
MNRRMFLTATSSAALVRLLGAGRAQADEIAPDVEKAVNKGLQYLARMQAKDGHLEGNGGQYPVALTALSGMAFLMEGSTLREGKYADSIRRITDYLLERARPNGLIGGLGMQESARYTYAHGFATLFLASGVFGEEDETSRREKLERVLTKAVEFIGKAQTSKGGWGYLAKGSYQEGDDQDEGSTTVTQLQALRAARNAGIHVPKGIIDNARKYMESVTTPQGGVLYRPGQPGERPALTAAAVACGFSVGEYDSAIVKKWIKSAQRAMGSVGGGGRMGHDEYAHYYFAQAVYSLGEKRYLELFPGTPERDCLTWSGYKAANFKSILSSQREDGSWQGSSSWSSIGPVYVTATYLGILQMDRGILPIYQR